MSRQNQVIVSKHETERGTLKSYLIGYVLSIGLTLVAYLLVVKRSYSNRTVTAGIIIGLALAQFTGQLLLFLHLGKETKPRWKLLVFGFMLIIVCILVFGSLWIMNNLNYRMTPKQVNTYLNNQGGGF